MDPAATVLRAGVMRFNDLRRNALVTFMDPRFKKLGISVRAGLGVEDKDLMTEPFPFPNPQMMRTNPERLGEAGFEIEATLEPHHATIWLPDIENHTLEALVSAFDSPEPNPAA